MQSLHNAKLNKHKFKIFRFLHHLYRTFYENIANTIPER
jgi:hypothetical protein